MREQPDGAALLAMAREVLRRELLPLLPKDKAYDALMIVNAMGIAERQLQQGEGPVQEEQRQLAALLGSDRDVASLQRLLALRIRAGEFDDHAKTQALLWQMTRQRVSESAPRALAAYGAE